MGTETGGKNPTETDLPKLMFKCCKTKETKNFVCICCGEQYHSSCLERLKGYTLVKGSLINCCGKDGDQAASINNLKATIAVLRGKLKEACDSSRAWKAESNKFEKLASSTSEEVKYLKKIAMEQDKNNKLMQDKVELLEENRRLMQSETGRAIYPTKTYANVTSNADKTASVSTEPPSSMPWIYVKPRNKQEVKVTTSDMKSKVNLNNLNLGVSQVKELKEGLVKIKCSKLDDVNKLRSELQAKMYSEYDVSVGKLQNPKIKILNLENYENDEDLENSIMAQNFSDLANSDKENIKIIHVWKNKKSETSTVLVSVLNWSGRNNRTRAVK